MIMMMAVLLAFGACFGCARGQAAGGLAPVVIPQKPAPYFSWDNIPTAFHGANKTGIYNDDAIRLLAQHQMVTIEKWYTPCASQGPTQGPPSCAVEARIEAALARVKAINPRVTGLLYLNSMLDFQFYTLHGKMEEAEARGQRSYLRDETGAVISLCNDGDVYCNITTFDWTQPHVRGLWLDTIANATKTGDVDGIFADHSAQEHIQIGAPTNGQKPNQLCNGVAGHGRTCYNFTPTFAASFNSWHTYMTNKSQDMLSKTTGGPVICGPEAMYGIDGCDFDMLRNAQKRLTVIEASGNRAGCARPTTDCLAAFLAAAENGTYLSCLAGAPTDWPERHYPLGQPDGPAREAVAGSGVWERRFASGTRVVWDNTKRRGNVTWGGGQPPPPSPPPPSPPPPPPGPLPPVCGRLLANTGVGNFDLGQKRTGTAAACCAWCAATPACKIWAWHTEQNNECHLHTAKGEINKHQGCYAGVLNRTDA